MNKENVFRLAMFALISLILMSFSYRILIAPTKYQVVALRTEVTDPTMSGIHVPPAEDSHPRRCLNMSENNKPGLLPGPRLGETLGLEDLPDLSLSSPIRAPLLEMKPTTLANKIQEGTGAQSCSSTIKNSPRLDQCLNSSIKESQIPTLTSEGYYRNRFEQCNPYNGSYCQCTNNYVPLPTVGYCQPYNRGMEVCPYPYKVSSAGVYQRTMGCLEG